MTTRHRLMIADSRELSVLPSESVHLIVSSPPYPMIRMWDGLFARLNPRVAECLERGDGRGSFEAMHAELDRVWRQLHRVLCPGGVACLNLGDATRSIGGSFQLYTNHARVLQACLDLGFQALPEIIWRKPTNSPTKFLGSGTLPAGAYVTLEHEWVLILRKGPPRRFRSAEERQRRLQSAFFWEERNRWFSDLWEVKGSRQELRSCVHAEGENPRGEPRGEDPGRVERRPARSRSGAFPLELASRLVLMFSIQGDTVLDPFLGSGTTMFAAAMAGRSCIGVEIDPQMLPVVECGLAHLVAEAGERQGARLQAHRQFVEERGRRGLSLAHRSRRYGFPVVSRQEREILLPLLCSLQPAESGGQSALSPQWVALYAQPPACAPESPPGGGHQGRERAEVPEAAVEPELSSSSRARGSNSSQGGSTG